ncbi:MAG TPA: carboxylesterase, partial [Chromatiales bacterium]|nr:carboxylesterase [Chromatiales bacterium]
LEQPLAGIMALSTYLPLRDTLSAERADANRHTPILMIHGRQDSVVPPPLAQISRQHLEALGHPVEWHAFDMGHSVIGEEIQVISQWLRAVLELHTSPE